jgi:hypothetical protein
VFTLPWNPRSPSRGFTVHDRVEYAINAKLLQIGVNIYGCCKQVAALISRRDDLATLIYPAAMGEMIALINRLHEPATWPLDVERKRLENRFPGE